MTADPDFQNCQSSICELSQKTRITVFTELCFAIKRSASLIIMIDCPVESGGQNVGTSFTYESRTKANSKSE